tara:strand:+ start:6390 stop:7799 length:1410 start_codon:yes stop_codon:yes gene_type:complete
MNNLKRYREVIFTSLLDFLIILASWFVFHSYNNENVSKLLNEAGLDFVHAGVLLSIYWITVFILLGLYKKLYLISRLDEFFGVVKCTIYGTLILFFLVTIGDTVPLSEQKDLIIFYWGVTFLTVALNRFFIRSIQRFYAQRGKGLHRTIIIGTGVTAKTAFDDLNRNKTLGMEVLGYIQVNGKKPSPESGIMQEEVIGHLNDIRDIITERGIQDILVAMEPDRRKDLIDVIAKVDYPDVSLKLLPDFYQLVSGLNKTNQIFGMPIIEISPEPMPLWEKAIKRILDIAISTIVLIVFMPVLVVIGILIKATSKGPAIFKQKRVGRNEKIFTILKFRTMFEDAEAESGPTWASENDPRITPLGIWLRRMRIDEIPQLMNVIKGDMSLVGPRPERSHFVDQFRAQIPLYTRRLRVRPGITGWAQVKWKYDSSFDDVKEKTKYDLYYVENVSLKMDAKILINTLITMIKGKGQ